MSPRRDLPAEMRRIERGAEILKAVAHPLRLRIVGLLEARERTVTELYGALETSQPHMSQQLNLLKTHGILTSRREGNHVYYTIAEPAVLDILKCACCRRLPAGRRRRHG